MLNQNFKDMLSALNDAKVEYLVVGAYAMAVHGCPRSTGDIDFWVRPTVENAKRVWVALTEFGAPMHEISLEDFSSSNVVFQIGLVPQRVDLLTSISGVEFDDAWASKEEVQIDGLSANVLGRTHLVKNKLASGRPKDLLDVEVLRKHQSE